MFKHHLILKVLLLVCNVLLAVDYSLPWIVFWARIAIHSEFLESLMLWYLLLLIRCTATALQFMAAGEDKGRKQGLAAERRLHGCVSQFLPSCPSIHWDQHVEMQCCRSTPRWEKWTKKGRGTNTVGLYKHPFPSQFCLGRVLQFPISYTNKI